jgi:hypothetical protein
LSQELRQRAPIPATQAAKNEAAKRLPDELGARKPEPMHDVVIHEHDALETID